MRRYQNGTLELVNTTAGPCWYIRFTENDGSRPRTRIGLKSELRTKSAASRAAQVLRDRFNAGELSPPPVYTVAMLIDRYEAEEMPSTYSTARGYRKIHKLYIRPRWGEIPVQELVPLDVRAWLRDLKLKNGTPASSRTRGHVHTQFKNLLKHAMLWRWMPPQVNPLALFSLEGATKRTRTPRVVTPDQFRALLGHFESSMGIQTMLVGAYCLGLRVSELFALKWGDFDHIAGTVTIQRGVVRGRLGKVKTERSNAPLPLAPQVGDAFMRWRAATPYREDCDWVFASPLREGRTMLDSNKIQSEKLRPAGTIAGLGFALGWHTLRHSYKSLLDRITSDAALKRDLMRHSDVHTTMQVYGEVEMDRMRAANTAAVELVLPSRVN